MASTGAHTVKAFDDELDQLRASIAEMGGLAEAAIAESMRALVQRDTQAALRVVENDRKLDALEAEVERQAVQIIALRAPMADDLRDVVAALKIAGVVERIGDYAKNIAKRVPVIEGSSNIEPLSLVPEMARIAGEMVRDVLDAGFDLGTLLSDLRLFTNGVAADLAKARAARAPQAQATY